MAQKSGRRSARRAPEVDLGFQWGMLNSILLAAGVFVLVGGYLALAGGSITLAPVLLVLGYCVLLPFFLWRSFQDSVGE